MANNAALLDDLAFTGIAAGVETVNSALSGRAKAVLRIKDNRANKGATISKEQMEKMNNKKGFGGFGAAGKLQSFTPSIGDMITGAIASKMGVDLGSDDYDKSIQVQFNPSSIRLRSNAGDDDVQITNYTQDDRGIGHGAMDIHVEMSVVLTFDQISNTAAFQQDLLGLATSTSALGSTAKNMLKNAIMGGSTIPLQTTVEAFISILRTLSPAAVCFEWGDLKYEGMLRQVNSNYTMFDMNGNPVRAEVGLMIYLVESATQDYSNGYWYDVYYETFIEGNPLAMAYAGLADLPSD